MGYEIKEFQLSNVITYNFMKENLTHVSLIVRFQDNREIKEVSVRKLGYTGIHSYCELDTYNQALSKTLELL
ncbi:hypothetical protein D3C75_678890 [compost metagenome]